MTDKKADPSQNLQTLAAEACDLWQEHLAAYATDPKAKAELMRLLEPSRRLFAEWAGLMQHGLYGGSTFGKGSTGSKSGTAASAFGSHHGEAGSSAGAATARSSFGDGALDVARLAARVAELENRLARLEPGAKKNTRESRATHRSRAKS